MDILVHSLTYITTRTTLEACHLCLLKIEAKSSRIPLVTNVAPLGKPTICIFFTLCSNLFYCCQMHLFQIDQAAPQIICTDLSGECWIICWSNAICWRRVCNIALWPSTALTNPSSSFITYFSYSFVSSIAHSIFYLLLNSDCLQEMVSSIHHWSWLVDDPSILLQLQHVYGVIF